MFRRSAYAADSRFLWGYTGISKHGELFVYRAPFSEQEGNRFLAEFLYLIQDVAHGFSFQNGHQDFFSLMVGMFFGG